MNRKRQNQNYLRATKNWERRSESQASGSPAVRQSVKGNNMNSTEKLKTRVSMDYQQNITVKEDNGDLNHLDQFEQDFQQTEEQPFLDLKIVHQQSPSADHAQSSQSEMEKTLVQMQQKLDQSNSFLMEDSEMPISIHGDDYNIKQTGRSTQYEFKTPKAGIDESCYDDFKGSCAKQIAVSKYNETNIEDQKQLDEILRKKNNTTQAFHNFKNSFQSFDNSLVNDHICVFTSGSNEKNQERGIPTDATLHVTSSMFSPNNQITISPNGAAIEQNVYKIHQNHTLQAEPEVQDDQHQPLSLNFEKYEDLEIRFTYPEIDANDLQAPGSSGIKEYNSISKKTGSIIAMGRQSSMVNNILNQGSYCKKKNPPCISIGRTPIHDKQFNTSSRSQLRIQKFQLGKESNHKRNITSQEFIVGGTENATNGIDSIYKSFDIKKQPMEPMIIQRSAYITYHQATTKSNYNTQTNSSTRLATRSSTRRTGTSKELPSKRNQSQAKPTTTLENKKVSHQTSQSVSFTGLSAETIARRKNSLSKDPFSKQQQQRQVLAKKANALKNFSQIKNGAYFQSNSQKTSSRCYNFSSNVKGTQNNEISMSNLKLNLLNGCQRNTNLLKDMISVRSAAKQNSSQGISEYVKQLKQNDKQILDNVYNDCYKTSKHVRDATKTSFKSCNSRSQSQESKYSKRSKRESRRSTKANSNQGIQQKQDSQKTRLSQLKQKYSGLNSLNNRQHMKLNSSTKSLHSVLSRANSNAVSKQELEKYTNSRNEPNSQQVSLTKDLQNVMYFSQEQDLDDGISNHMSSQQNQRVHNRHQTRSVNYQSSFKNIRSVHSRVQELRNSICITAKNTKGTFEDAVKIEKKKQAEALKNEKMREAKKNANNYLRRGIQDSKERSGSLSHNVSSYSIVHNDRSVQRVSQQKVIQDKLFERYKLESKRQSNKKVENKRKLKHQIEKEKSPQKFATTPERANTSIRQSSVTPDQKKSYQRFSKNVKFININLGGIMKGYKVRRLYHNNFVIRENRTKFRDLVQFVFFLQEEVNDINQKLKIIGDDSILTAEYNHAQEFLGKALEEIISIRIRFQEEFYRSLQDCTWIKETLPHVEIMEYKEESKFYKIKTHYLNEMKTLLIKKKEKDAQDRLLQLNLAETKSQIKIYKTTQISTINDLNTLEEADDDIMQEMERQLKHSWSVYPVKMQNESPKMNLKESTSKFNIIENNYQSPEKIQMSAQLQKNLKSLQSSQKMASKQQTQLIDIQENDSPPRETPGDSKFGTTLQTPYQKSPLAKKEYQNNQSPILSPDTKNLVLLPQPESPKDVTYEVKQTEIQSPEESQKKSDFQLLSPEMRSPIKYCQKIQESKYQKQLSPSKRPISSPQKIQKLINSMMSTPEKFESRIPRCTSNSNSKIPKAYREAFLNSKSKIPRSKDTRPQSVSSSHSKPRTAVPKLNLSKIGQYCNDQSPLPQFNEMAPQEVEQKQQPQPQPCKSVLIDLQCPDEAKDSEQSFEEKLEYIKKQSMNIKSMARESMGFNNSKKFENSGPLGKVEEEESNINNLNEVSYLQSEQSDFNINLIHVLGTESEVFSTVEVDDIRLQVDQDKVHQKVSIFSNSQSACSSILESSKHSKSTYQSQFNKRKLSREKANKSFNVQNVKSSQKKTDKKKISPMKENSPYKVSKFNQMNTISTENLRNEKQSPTKSSNKGSPIKEHKIVVLGQNHKSQPVSSNFRRPRNQRSCDKSAQKPKMAALEPFKDQTEACINSPQINIPEQYEQCSSNNASKQSQDQLLSQVSQIQQMIMSLQKQKSESAVSSNGQVFDDAYKQQFEQMINGLKNQFDALTK